MKRSIISDVQKRMLSTSIRIERLIRRPPDSLIPRQFLNDSLMKRWVGIVENVLSQFWIFTV